MCEKREREIVLGGGLWAAKVAETTPCRHQLHNTQGPVQNENRDPLFKNDEELQDSDSRALNHDCMVSFAN